MERKKLSIFGISVCLVLVLSALFPIACAAPIPTPTPSPTTPSPAGEEVIHWTLQLSDTLNPTFGPYGPYVGESLVEWPWRDWLEEATGGRLEIEMLPPNAVYPDEEALKAVGAGAVDAARSGGGRWAGIMPEMKIIGGMPGTWQTTSEMFVGLYVYGLYDKVVPLFDPYNVVYLPAPKMETMNIFSTFPMPNPEAIKNRKIRIWGQWGSYIDAIGGVPVALPYGDVYMGLKLGTIEATFTGIPALENIKLHEVVTDFVTNPNPCTSCILINRDSFNALPEDIQGLIMRESRFHFAGQGLEGVEQALYLLAHAAEKYGLNLWTWSDKDMMKVRQLCKEKIWPEFAAETPLCAEMVELVKKQMKEHGRL